MYNERVLFASAWDSKLALMRDFQYFGNGGNGVRSLALKKRREVWVNHLYGPGGR